MKYKLIATDYDRTLSDDVKGVSKYTKRVIHEYIARGGKFIISTGRIIQSILKYANMLNLKGEIITFQGASTYDIETCKLIDSCPLCVQNSIDALKYIENNIDGIPQACYSDGYYVEKENPFTNSYSSFCKVNPNYTNIKLSEYVKKRNEGALKILILVEECKMNEYLDLLSKNFSDRLSFTQSHKNLLEIVNINASKGNAVKKLAEKYNIKQDEVMTFGDATNDLSMIEYAGMGVAVGNAMPELKEKANYVCESVDMDGVAKTIEKFCFDV